MFKKILIPLDRSPLAEDAIGQGAALARASGADVELLLVHQPVPFAGFRDAPWDVDAMKEENAYLASIGAELASGAGVRATHSVIRGEAAEMIRLRAADASADLIVMTSHGRTGWSRAWLGSVADSVLRHSEIPVLMLRSSEAKAARRAAHHVFKHVFVPYDGSSEAAAAFGPAGNLAKCAGARLTLFRAVEPVPLLGLGTAAPFTYPLAVADDPATELVVTEATVELAEAAKQIATDFGIEVGVRVVVATHTADAIVDNARVVGADVIAMATHGRGSSRLLIGSIADKVLRAGDLPTLLIRPQHRPATAGEGPAYVETHATETRL